MLNSLSFFALHEFQLGHLRSDGSRVGISISYIVRSYLAQLPHPHTNWILVNLFLRMQIMGKAFHDIMGLIGRTPSTREPSHTVPLKDSQILAQDGPRKEMI